MFYELFIGLRYLKSKRKQTFISIITFISIGGVAVGVMTLIVVLSVMTGFEEDMRNKILGTNPHIIAQKWGGLNITDYRKIIAEIKRLKGVKSVSPFIYNQVMLSTEANVAGVVIRGIDPEDEEGVTNLKQYIQQGNLKDLSGEEAGIILGKELYQNLGSFPEEEITMISPQGRISPLGMVPRMKKFKVVGKFTSGMFEYDSGLAFISLENAQKFFNLGDSVSGIGIKLDNIYLAPQTARKIEKKIGSSYILRTWMEMNKNLFSALRLEKILMFIILTLIILVAAFNIVSTLIMVVMEKGKDIAILKSMGTSNQSIIGIFSLQGLIIGFFGTLLGFAGGLLIVSSLDTIIAFLENIFQMNIFPSDIYYLDKLPVKVNYFDVFLTGFCALSISIAAAIYPALRAAGIDPVEAIRKYE